MQYIQVIHDSIFPTAFLQMVKGQDQKKIKSGSFGWAGCGDNFAEPSIKGHLRKVEWTGW